MYRLSSPLLSDANGCCCRIHEVKYWNGRCHGDLVIDFCIFLLLQLELLFSALFSFLGLFQVIARS